ncbi:MAG: hypothetical protein R3F14_07950 [Polyangiaceae bacterium]
MKNPTLAALGLVLTACSQPAPPPAVAPQPPPARPLPPPPWERGSIADGFEMPVPLGPMVVIRGATLLLATGKTIPRGTLVLDKGKIAAVFEGDAPAPPSAIVIDGTGKFVTPGLIDTHSHLGVYPMPGAAAHADGNEMVAPVTPQAQAADAFWPQDPGIERAVAGGVTAIQVLPGSGNLIGGRAITVKLRPALSSRAMHFRGAPDGLKMACGENPKRVYGTEKKPPMTRMGNLAMQRAAFFSAKQLQQDWQKWSDSETRRAAADLTKQSEYTQARQTRAYQQALCKDSPDAPACEAWSREWQKPIPPPEPSEPSDKPARDPGLETLIGAMTGKVLVHVHCYRADDMLDMLSLGDEVGFKVKSFHHALEAYKIRETRRPRRNRRLHLGRLIGDSSSKPTMASPKTRPRPRSRRPRHHPAPTPPKASSASTGRPPRPSPPGRLPA